MPFRPGNLRAASHRGRVVDLVAGHDAAGLRALLAQDARELARVDAGDRDDLAALAGTRQRLVARQLLVQRRQVADDQARGVDLRGLEVLGRGAGVADVRIGERDDLSRSTTDR